MYVATDKNPTIVLDANAYLSRIPFAQKADTTSWVSEKRHKMRRDQGVDFCSGANMGAPLTPLEAPKILH
jgi:hypothetical protein